MDEQNGIEEGEEDEEPPSWVIEMLPSDEDSRDFLQPPMNTSNPSAYHQTFPNSVFAQQSLRQAPEARSSRINNFVTGEGPSSSLSSDSGRGESLRQHHHHPNLPPIRIVAGVSPSSQRAASSRKRSSSEMLLPSSSSSSTAVPGTSSQLSASSMDATENDMIAPPPVRRRPLPMRAVEFGLFPPTLEVSSSAESQSSSISGQFSPPLQTHHDQQHSFRPPQMLAPHGPHRSHRRSRPVSGPVLMDGEEMEEAEQDQGNNNSLFTSAATLLASGYSTVDEHSANMMVPAAHARPYFSRPLSMEVIPASSSSSQSSISGSSLLPHPLMFRPSSSAESFLANAGAIDRSGPSSSSSSSVGGSHGGCRGVAPMDLDAAPYGLVPKSVAVKRLRVELEELRHSPIPHCHLAPIGDSGEKPIFDWLAVIDGPPKTPYAGGTFFVEIQCSDDYPFVPPEVIFRTRIYHCNIDAHGQVQGQPAFRGWTPDNKLSDIVRGIVELMHRPLAFPPDDSLRPRLAVQCIDDPEQFERNARDWTQHFAQ